MCAQDCYREGEYVTAAMGDEMFGVLDANGERTLDANGDPVTVSKEEFLASVAGNVETARTAL